MREDRDQGSEIRDQKRITDEQLKGLHDVAVARSKKGWPQIRKSWADVGKALQELIELRKASSIPLEGTVEG
ncbi:MAG: hypothetical protein ABSG00_06905 [Terracidiphilus sp.]|jgi:hypothetical protein